MRLRARVLATLIFFASGCVGVLSGVMLARAQATSTAPAPSSVDTEKVALQQELTQINGQISQLEGSLANTQATQTTLQGALKVLDNQISLSKLDIERRDLAIQSTSQSIQDEEDAIAGLNDKLGSEQESLAAMLRETNELDHSSLLVLALSSSDISDFLADLGQFGQINEQMQQSFTVIQSDTETHQTEESDLQDQLQQETQLKQVQQLQQQQLQDEEDQKNALLAQTKGQEKSYQGMIASKQQSAAQIEAALFALTGTKAIPFGTAVQYADEAEKATGIRPAFLLGIIAEESNLGANVGTGNWQTDMGPGQKAMFQEITSSLGLDPNAMPVSKKQWYGYGGAMGPAQFIPNTWGGLAGYTASGYDPSSDRIGELTGDKPPNPWNPQDAFMAAALYLTDDGAAKQTPSAEFYAAMCYLAGCSGANDPDLQFYGNQVASLATQFQGEIDVLNKAGS
ncbi:MAG: hypothetical protein ACRD22_02095 [Terriglobia bacterium]